MIYLKKDSIEENELLDRFVRYAKIYSQSSSEAADKGQTPSTECQWDFAKKLCGELNSLGFSGVELTDSCYIYAFTPATKGKENIPPFCLLAHMDTVEEVSGKNVAPDIIKNYDGKIIELKNGIVLNPEEIKALSISAEKKETIITTDGTTLLGGDDKAGIAAIVTSLHYLIQHPEIEHGKIEVIFSPDEETGHGMDKVPLEKISSKYAYTVDGGHEGELEYECFNAYKSDIVFYGKASHTGNARENKMVNAISMASAFIQSLPHCERPETTDGYDGFYAPLSFNGSMEAATVTLFLRDFTKEGMEKRKSTVERLAEAAALSYNGKCTVTHQQQYLNMREKIDESPYVKDILIKAYREAEVTPIFNPIRGGTDGSRLTEFGIPCPNIFTGAHNYHSQREWVSLDQMRKASDIIIHIAEITANQQEKKS